MFKNFLLILTFTFSQTLSAQVSFSHMDETEYLAGTSEKTTTPNDLADMQPSLQAQKITLEAEKVESTVILIWETEAKQNSERFLVQRKISETALFETIDELEADGNAAQFIHFDDLPVNGKTQYRLIEIKKDGTQIEHEMVPLEVITPE